MANESRQGLESVRLLDPGPQLSSCQGALSDPGLDLAAVSADAPTSPTMGHASSGASLPRSDTCSVGNPLPGPFKGTSQARPATLQLIHTALSNGNYIFFERAPQSEIHFISNLIHTHKLKLLQKHTGVGTSSHSCIHHIPSPIFLMSSVPPGPSSYHNMCRSC